MTEDEIFTGFAKAAIDKYPTIPSNNRCSKCPIRFIENSISKSRINKHIYLNKNAKHEGSTCFLIAQKIQLLKIAKINGIFCNMMNHGYINCSKNIKVVKFYDFNKI